MATVTWYVVKTSVGYVSYATDWRNRPFDEAVLFRTKQAAMCALKNNGDKVVPVTLTYEDE